jgi:hypothetical protein
LVHSSKECFFLGRYFISKNSGARKEGRRREERESMDRWLHVWSYRYIPTPEPQNRVPLTNRKRGVQLDKTRERERERERGRGREKRKREPEYGWRYSTCQQAQL